MNSVAGRTSNNSVAARIRLVEFIVTLYNKVITLSNRRGVISVHSGGTCVPDSAVFGRPAENLGKSKAPEKSPARELPQWATVSASRKLDRPPGLCVLLSSEQQMA